MDYLNPFTLVRWIFFGKSLTEILSGFEKTQTSLDRFYGRTEVRLRRKQARINKLAAQNVTHAEHMSKAKLVKDNLTTLMTQVIGPAPKDSASA
jgi:hypothetical protein